MAGIQILSARIGRVTGHGLSTNMHGSLALPDWSPAYITTMVAVFGTTISPYLFFWQASQAVEELRANPRAKALKHAPRDARARLTRIEIETCIGMGVSNLVAYFIMLTTAVTLNLYGVRDIQSASLSCPRWPVWRWCSPLSIRSRCCT